MQQGLSFSSICLSRFLECVLHPARCGLPGYNTCGGHIVQLDDIHVKTPEVDDREHVVKTSHVDVVFRDK